MSISIIIPNYNGEELLKKNLPKVFEAAEFYTQKLHEQVEVIVIDDCSTDNSLDEIQNAKIKSQNYKVKFKSIKNERNVGFSSTVNRGVKEAEGEIVVLLNTDVAPQKDFLEPLVVHFKDKNVFAVGCMDKSIEKEKIMLRGRGIGRWQRGFLIHKRGEVDKTNTLWASGGSSAFKKSLWETLGGFHTLYNPFYWEDIDLSYRAVKAGYVVSFDANSVVKHEHNEGAIKQTYSAFAVKTVAYRNQFIFVWLNASDTDILLSHVAWLPYHVILALLRWDLAFVLGFFYAFKMLPKVLQLRRQVQKLSIKSDKEVIKEFAEEVNDLQ